MSLSFKTLLLCFFKNVLKHELLHGLGLEHYTGIVVSDSKPLMRGNLLDFFERNNLVSEQVGFYTQRSLSCNYDLDSLRQRLPL